MCILVFVCMSPIKKMIKWEKNIINFRGVLSVRSKPMWIPHLWEDGSDSFRGKKIISSKILVVKFTQMNFNRR